MRSDLATVLIRSDAHGIPRGRYSINGDFDPFKISGGIVVPLADTSLIAVPTACLSELLDAWLKGEKFDPNG